MTKLSDIVHLRNLLDNPEVCPDFDPAHRLIGEFMYYIQTHPVKLHDVEKDLLDSAAAVRTAYTRFQDRIFFAKEKCQMAIDALSPEYYQKSIQLYEQEMIFETPEYILNRRLHTDNDSRLQLQGRLLQLTDWRLPGLIFRPGLETFIEDLVPLDPMYIVDHNQELLQPAISKFTNEYQRRLRIYIVDDYQPGEMLEKLPNNQFGLIFAYNYFNYKPIEVINRYLEELFDKLRPGGSVIMTYNDCDRDHGVQLAEKNFMCYTPGQRIVNSAENVGLELFAQHTGQGDLSWFEFKKPGDIQSLRGGQTLAKIMPK
jgi:SAM-dependent methyltransferase